MKTESLQFITDLLGLNAEQQKSLVEYITTLEGVTGNTRAIDQWSQEHRAQWSLALRALGLAPDADRKSVRDALTKEITTLNATMREFFDSPDLTTEDGWNSVLNRIQESIDTEELSGYFLKHESAKRILQEHPPTELLTHFGIDTVDELIERHGIEAVFAAFRFAVSPEYNDSLIEKYKTLTPDDFEHRQTNFVLMPTADWFELAADFAKAKLHPFSHLKEMGIIFVVPNPDAEEDHGVFKLLVTLLMHYIYEVRFYSRYFERLGKEKEEQFGGLVAQAIMGSIVADHIPENGVRITHQYYTKKPHPDARVFEPHVMPEPIHWHNGRRLLRDLMCKDPRYQSCILDFWDTCYTVGAIVGGILVSLNYADNIVSTEDGDQKHYHLFEDIWNQLFIAFSSEHRLEQELLDHLEDGYIDLTVLER